MPDNNISILSTRPINESLINKAKQNNITLDAVTFIEIKKEVAEDTLVSIFKLAERKASVVFTSMNAVEIVVAILSEKSIVPDWKIYSMSGTTLTLLKQYWPGGNIIAIAKDSEALSAKIISEKPNEVFFFCGNRRREELPALLVKASINVNELCVYETIDIPQKLNKYYNGILFFSPSAVQSFFAENVVDDSTILFAIGNTTAKTIRQFSGNQIILSEFPSKDQMVNDAIDHFVLSRQL